MMARTVRLRMTSRQPEGRTEFAAAAELFVRPGGLYYRYKETDPNMGDTQTTLKIADEAIHVIRHGEVRSEQVFRVGRRMNGYYARGPLRLNLTTDTIRMRRELEDGIGRLEWAYDVYVDETLSHRVEIGLDIQEGLE